MNLPTLSKPRIQQCLLLLCLLLAGLNSAHATNELIYSTLLGGELADEALAVAVDANGRLYVTGRTQSTSFPASQPHSANPAHGVDAYIARLSANGSQLDYILWFNAISGSDIDEALAITIDASGAAYVVGQTHSSDFCTLFGNVPGHNPTYSGNGDAFLLKVKPDGSGLAFCTFLGGSDWDIATAIALTADGRIHVSGSSWSTDFPTSDGSSHSGLRDLFVATFDPSGTQLQQATLLGGSGQEESKGLALDAAGQLYLTGWTNSPNFPTSPNSYSPTPNGSFDSFITQLAPDLTPGYSSYLGSSGEDRPTAIHVAADGTATIIGDTQSAQFPVTTTAVYQGKRDIFLAQLDPSGSTLTFATLAGGAEDEWATGLAAGENGRFWLTGHTFSTTWGADIPGYDPTPNGGQDSYLLQINPTANHPLSYASYLGGSDDERGGAVTIANGHAYLAGDTRSPNFPLTPGSYSQTPSGDYDLYLTKLALPPTESSHRLFLPTIRR